jgi:hypothetical protein
MNEKEALLVIEEMISKTKSEIKDNGFYFLFWGWLVFIAALSNYFLLVFTDFEMNAIPWMILMPFGGVVMVIFAIRDRKKAPRVKTYIDDMVKYMIRAFSLSLFVVCLFMPMSGNFTAFYPTIMIIYATWLYVSGGILKSKALLWGGLLNWVLAAVCFIWTSLEVHLLLIAVAVLGGYIIPGYLLKRKFKLNVQRA